MFRTPAQAQLRFNRRCEAPDQDRHTVAARRRASTRLSFIVLSAHYVHATTSSRTLKPLQANTQSGHAVPSSPSLDSRRQSRWALDGLVPEQPALGHQHEPATASLGEFGGKDDMSAAALANCHPLERFEPATQLHESAGASASNSRARTYRRSSANESSDALSSTARR